jgi:catechol-2,3-dioxygenase
MTDIPMVSLSHIGIVVKDIALMEAFYTGVLGFEVTDRGVGRGHPIVFLSRDSREHHQIVLQEDPASGKTTINQISFRMANLGELRALHLLLKRATVKEMHLVDHAVSWSVYCHDPEGNRLEFFVDAPYYVHQPIYQPLEIEKSDGEIRRATEAHFRADPSFISFDEWKTKFAERL